ncbi:ABC transporter permease [Bacillus sp. FJAT-52991]|uniref:ABC transporter permease n=1 Tax=Bacillus kandeliae TaxID=3129297 RepID=A0ABZ2N7B9_9BACI
MITILQTELLKLRRTMVQWMGICVIIIPIVFNFIYVILSSIMGNTTFNWGTALIYANFLLTVLIAPIFYAGIASYIFSREYREGTAEAHFTYPYKRTSFFIGKMMIIFLFIILSCFIIFSVNLIICLFFADVPPPPLFIKTGILDSIKISATQCALVCITILASIAFRNIVAGILTAVIGCATAIAMLFSAVGDWQLLNPYFFSMVVTDIQNYEQGYIYLGMGAIIIVGVLAFLSALHLYKNNDITNK